MYSTLWFLYLTVWDRENAGILGKTDKEKQTFSTGISGFICPSQSDFIRFLHSRLRFMQIFPTFAFK